MIVYIEAEGERSDPKLYNKTIERIKVEQRRLSKRRSNNWLKQILKLNRLRGSIQLANSLTVGLEN